MYVFSKQFKALDETVVEDPLGLGTRWTIAREGAVEDKAGAGKSAEIVKALAPLMLVESLPRRMQKRIDNAGIVQLLRESASTMEIGALLSSDEVIDSAVARVRNIDPVETVDESGARKRVAFNRDRAREILTLADPVPADLVSRVLALRPGDLPEEPEQRAEVEDVHRIQLQTIRTLGALLRAWVLRVSAETELYREEVVEEAGESSGPGRNGSPATSRTSETPSASA